MIVKSLQNIKIIETSATDQKASKLDLAASTKNKVKIHSTKKRESRKDGKNPQRNRAD